MSRTLISEEVIGEFLTDKFRFALRLGSETLFTQRFLLVEKRPALLLRLAQLGTHGIEFFLEDRSDRVLDDVRNDMIGRVIRAGGFALVLVVLEIHLAFFLDPILTFEAIANLLLDLVKVDVDFAAFFFHDAKLALGDAQFELQ